MNFVSFPDVELFHNIVKYVDKYVESPPKITYKAKVKLHGTNAGVRIRNGEVAAQSRSQIITPDNDNNGFAKWVEANKDFFLTANTEIGGHEFEMTIFGEWCGPGIQKGTAINQVGRKQFAIFSILLNATGLIVVEPEEIKAILGDLPEDIKVLPWESDSLLIDFSSKDSLQDAVNHINEKVLEVEHCDPFVKETFGIEGLGEGLVYYPFLSTETTIKEGDFDHYVFKAKGEKHRVVKAKVASQINPAIAESIEEFAKLFVTEARLEQGVTATGGEISMRNIGPFLKWFATDVQKESVAELEASGLTWHQVQKPVQDAARKWFVEKAKVII